MRPKRSSNEQAVRAALRLGQHLHFSGEPDLRIRVALVSRGDGVTPSDQHARTKLAVLCTLHPRVAGMLIDELGPGVRITCTPLARRVMKRHGSTKADATR